jgi:hypothetical protein
VCERCNSGPLSALDVYICRLYDAQFSRIARAREPRTFLYDYDLLLRWLLKASYNSARANSSDVAALSTYRSFILDGGVVPSGIDVQLELIRPSSLRSHGSRSETKLPPSSVRCCRVQMSGPLLPGLTLRLVALNSFYFWILLSPPGSSVDDVLTELPGTRLVANANRVSLFAVRETVELHADWAANPQASLSMKAFRARRAK